MKTGVLLIGFGGPESMEEVRPFLESVLRGVKIPQARFDEVMHHYEVIGGVSPYNAITQRQKAALEKELVRRGADLPVFTGYRHSSPSLADALREMKSRGIEQAAGFVLASLRSYASFQKYTERVEEAKKETGAENITLNYTAPFHENPLFIEAQADEVLKALSRLGDGAKDKTFFIFSAHSIPSVMAAESGYDKQFERTAGLIAQKMNISAWTTAYQSRSGNPRDPWLEPSVEKAVSAVDRGRFENVLLIPSGFLCDNVEVIYDLDREIREHCRTLNLRYERASTVADHPQFIRLAADLIQAALA